MSDSNVIAVPQPKVVRKSEIATFHVRVVEVKNPHKAQLTLDYGSTPGPWVRVGVNSTIYAAGYLPKESRKKKK
jgi:hypothetical protein